MCSNGSDQNGWPTIVFLTPEGDQLHTVNFLAPVPFLDILAKIVDYVDQNREALREASQRGVRVRLILSSRNTDLKPIRYAGRGYYKELLEAGVEVYEYKPSRLHAKTVIVDGAPATKEAVTRCSGFRAKGS